MRAFILPFVLVAGLAACEDDTSAKDTATTSGDDDDDTVSGDDDDDTSTDGFVGNPGDCSVIVPADAKVITSNGVSNSAGDVALVCEGANYVGNSGSGRFFVLDGAQVSVNSGNTWVWAKGSAEVVLNGTNSEITVEPSVTTSGFANDTITVECTTITIDTSRLPGGGC